MDTTDPEITFDQHGVCNHCLEYNYKIKEVIPPPEEAAHILERKIAEIKKAGDGKEYDCVIGISGGVDSSYVAYLVKKKFNLRPLAVHLDNGWNSREAVKNIQNIVRKLEIDLHTHVINWEEFRDLQIAYFKASVIDIEALTDHAISALLYNTAFEKDIPYILFGTNRMTEQILPSAWNFKKNDLVNIRDIHARFGKVPLLTYPQLGKSKLNYYHRKKHIRTFSPLDYIKYVKEDAKKILQQELEWMDYGGKHHESVFTRFYQGYILPRKFNVDKRKCHYATLINSGQMTREEALEELKKPTYSEAMMSEDYDFVVKKLGFENSEFERLMALPANSHLCYKTDFQSKLDYKVYPKIYPLYKKAKIIFPWLERVYKRMKIHASD